RRKVAPLKKSLAGYELWFTGVRRDEAPTRINTPLITFDEKNGLVKVNPLAAWSFDDLLDYARAFEVPVNPLLSQGYPSIGCQPCTRPVAEGEDPRAGRWAGTNKTECGLHTCASTTPTSTTPASTPHTSATGPALDRRPSTSWNPRPSTSSVRSPPSSTDLCCCSPAARTP